MERIAVKADLRMFESATENSRSYYVVIADGPAEAIRSAAMTGQWATGKRRFGVAKVMATVGKTVWATAVYPEKDSGGWFLPIKIGVCRAEGLQTGELVDVTIEL